MLPVSGVGYAIAAIIQEAAASYRFLARADGASDGPRSALPHPMLLIIPPQPWVELSPKPRYQQSAACILDQPTIGPFLRTGGCFLRRGNIFAVRLLFSGPIQC